MKRIPEHKVEEIYHDSDIVEVIGDYVELKKAGGVYKGLSPFQDEKTPSFCVWNKWQSYKCFSSGKGGKVAQFLMEMEGYTYPEALRHLAKKYNIDLDDEDETEEEKKARQLFHQYRLTNDLTTHFYHQQLKNSNLQYFQSRGLTEESITEWKLGYASNHWDRFTSFALGRNVPAQTLLTLGISTKSKKGNLIDRFRNRVVFPIYDMMGNACGFGARALDKETAKYGKYVNSSDSIIYKKNALLYGLHITKTHIGRLDQAILLEGYMDTLMLYQHGIKNVVASSGTALSIQQVKLIKRFTNNVLMIYDGDKAGIKAASRNIDLFLQESMSVKCLLLPNDNDPDDFIREVGEAGFRAYVKEKSISWIEYLVNTSELNKEDPDDAAKLVKALLKKIQIMPDTVDQAVYLEYIQQQFNINISLNENGTLTAIPTTGETNEAQKTQTIHDHHPQTTKGQHAQLQLSKKRNWGEYVKLMNYLNIPLSEDFEQARDGSIQINYKEINGKAYRISGANKKKVNAIRQTSSHAHINAVYIPSRLRSQEKWDDYILMIVQDEITAHILTEFGIPAIGINNPLGFLSRPTQKEPHKLIKQTMRDRGFSEVMYAIDHKAFVLPPGGQGNTPYLNKDSAANADAFVNVLSVLKETFKRTPTSFIYADLNHEATDMRRPHWIDRLFMRMREHLPHHWMTPIIRSEIYDPDPEVNLIKNYRVDTGTPYSFREALYVNEVGRFVQLHGIEKLGKAFQWGKNIYEYNPLDSSVGIQSIADDAYTVLEKFGRYYGRSRDGEQAISDFTMKYVLEIKQENSLFLIEFKPLSGASCFIVVNARDILSADAFKQRVIDIEGGKFNFWGSKNQLEQIHAMCRRGVKEAKSLDNVLGYQKKYNIYVYGNGILDAEGNFHEIDSQGVVNYTDKCFYIPALSSFNAESRDYHIEKTFLYLEPNVDFEEYASSMLKVHGYTGHMAVAYLVASLYRDMFRDKIGKFNHLSIQAPPSAGKTTLINHLSAFWGKIPATNLQTKIRVAAFERKMELMVNSLMILNEFNLSNPKIQQLGLPDYLKGTYDFEGGEKTINNKSRQSMPNSAFMIVGQEAFWHKEALIKRCVVAEKGGKRTYTAEETRLHDELQDMVDDGISGFNSIFFSNRELVGARLKPEVRRLQKLFQKLLRNPQIESRQLENWAMTLAPLFILIREGKIRYPLSIDAMVEHAINQIEEQSNKMINDGVLAIFFTFIESEYGPRKLLDHQDVWLFQRENQLRIKLNSCYKHFLSYIRRENLGIENTSKNDMIDRMLEHPACQQNSRKQLPKGIQVGYAKDSNGQIVKRGESQTPVAATSGAQVITFDYSAMTDFTLPDVEWTSDDYIDERAPALIPEYSPSDSPFQL